MRAQVREEREAAYARREVQKGTREGLAESPYNYRPIETINSTIKRTTGDTAYGKSMASIEKEILCTVLAHNLKLLLVSGLVR